MNEFQQDLKKLIDHVKCFQEKHDCCVLNAVAKDLDEEKAACGVMLKGGEPVELHMLCHALLRSPRFVDEMMDAIKCIVHHLDPHKEKDSFRNFLMDASLESLKKLLLLAAVKLQEAEKDEKDADEAVKNLLNEFYHGNSD